MSLIKIKSGAIVSQQVVMACAVVNAANTLGIAADMLITSGRDGQHRIGSLHYEDKALDFRTKHLTTDDKRALVKRTKQRLGLEYDVLLEQEGKANEHLHVERDDP